MSDYYGKCIDCGKKDFINNSFSCNECWEKYLKQTMKNFCDSCQNSQPSKYVTNSMGAAIGVECLICGAFERYDND